MKNFFLVFFSLFSILSFSQEYHFDYFIKNKSQRFKQDQGNWEFDGLLNSETGLEVFFKTNNKKIVAVTNDRNKSLRHIFRVSRIGEKYNFFYKYSNRINTPSEKYRNLNKENVITAKRIDNLNYKIFVYKDSTLKKINKELLITLAESDFNYLKINADYNRSDEMEIELKNMLPSDTKFVITTIQYLNSRGKVHYKTNYEITSKIDFFLNVPDKLILKEYNYWSDFED